MHIEESELRCLIDACKNNDRRAQEMIYKTFYDSVYNTAYSYIEDKQRTEEVTNNAFLVIFKKIGTFGFKGSFDGWTKKISMHAACDYLKANNIRNSRLILKDFESPLRSNNDNRCIEKDVIGLLKVLPKTTKKVFEMYMQGFKHPEIASIMNIVEGTSKWHVAEARTILKNKLLNA